MGSFRRIAVLLLFSILAFFVGTVTAADNTTELVSIPINGSQSNDYSYESSISEDGRYVAFSSYANNLVNDDNNYYSDIFVRDRLLNITERISISNNGEEGNGNSYEPFISSDGRYVTFTSYASNLVENDTGDFADIFVRDRLLNITQRLSVSNTSEEGNDDSYGSSISSDGRYVAFYSYANNLVENDTNGFSDIFVFDRTSNTIKRINIPSNGEEANSDRYEPIISADGNFIAFTSEANNLVQNDDNNASDVFVFHQNSNSIKIVSISIKGGNANGGSCEPSISSDGRYIAFSSWADNLVDNDTNGRDVFVYDQISGITERVSISSTGEELNEDNYNPSISRDGRYIAFVSGHASVAACEMLLIFGDNDNIVDIFVHDRLSKITKKVSVSSSGEEANENSDDPAISGDGQYVAFNSYANNLVQGYNGYCGNIFIHHYSNLSTISAILYPEIVQSGDQITVRAYSPDSISVNALILGNTFEMEKRTDGLWYLEYIVPTLPDGVYDVLLTATDIANDQEQIMLDFTVDNTSPVISGTVTPNRVKSGDYISIDAVTSSDTISVTALIFGETFDLYQQDTGWNLNYWIMQLSDGNYPIILTATDKVGNQNTTLLNFTIDNTPPTFSGSITPDTVKTYDNITITANSDSADTTRISALILNQTYDLIKQTESTWILQYTIPYTPDGNYPIILTAQDIAGNIKTINLSFNVINPPDAQTPVVSGTVTHNNMINGVFPDRSCIYFQAFSDPDVISVTALVLGNFYTLYRQEDGSWTSWYFDWLEEGNYSAVITAQDWSGNQGSQTINFTVLNIIPTITSSVSSYKIRSGDTLVLTVNVNPDPEKVYVYVSKPNKFMNLEKQTNGSWTLNYTVPTLEDGYKTIYITCLYGIGWFRPDYTTIISAESSIGFVVDNTPPTFSVSITPNPIRSGDTLKIRVSCTSGSYFVPEDTAKVTATIFGNTFNLNWLYKWSEWFKSNSGSEWSIETTVPNLPDGIYPVLITATDDAGNQNTKIINLTIDNTPPTITATITPNKLKYIDFSRPTTSIMVQSSSDTKEIHAYLESGSGYNLQYSDNNWILQLKLPYLIPLGTYIVKLKASDYAGNEAESSVTYYVYQNLNVKNPIIKPTEPKSDSTNNNAPTDGSSSTESSPGETSIESSTAFSGESASTSADDPHAGTKYLKILLLIFLLLGDLLTILSCLGYMALLIWALLTVWSLLGFFTGLFVLFSIALIVVALLMVIFLIYKSYAH